MHYYSSNTPKVGQVILGHLINEKEEENCLYVRIPEYNNIQGMIPKSNLPKKRRTFKRVLAQMRKDVIVPCMLKTEPKFDDDGTPWLLDLTLKRIDRNSKQVFIDRFDNITRCLKVMKFLSEETEIDLKELMAGLWSDEIEELFADRIIYDGEQESDSDSDSDSESDASESESPQVLVDLADLYQKLLGGADYLIEVISRGTELSSELEQKIRGIMEEHVHAKKSDCTIQFDFRVDRADDPVEVLRGVFTDVLEQNPDLTILYKGAPTYSIIKSDVSPDELEDEIDALEDLFERALEEYEGCVYHLKFSLKDSEAKEPVYSFSFPRLVEV